MWRKHTPAIGGAKGEFRNSVTGVGIVEDDVPGVLIRCASRNRYSRPLAVAVATVAAQANLGTYLM